MISVAREQELIARSIEGDRVALAELLLAHHDRLARYVGHKIPASLRSLVAVEDVLQESYVQVFRKIDGYDLQDHPAFYRWLRAIAKNKLLDMIRAQRRAKREGARRRVHAASGATSLAPLLAVVARHSGTPSGSAARREGEAAVRVALAGLKDDYRRALLLRYLQGLSAAEVGRRMRRTEAAVYMLCQRGVKQLKEALGNSSKYFSA